MMRYRRDAYEFEKIYLPDVFSGPEMKYTLALLLLADVTKKPAFREDVSAFCPGRSPLCQKGKDRSFIQRFRI